jgi:hypothetical protein
MRDAEARLLLENLAAQSRADGPVARVNQVDQHVQALSSHRD